MNNNSNQESSKVIKSGFTVKLFKLLMKVLLIVGASGLTSYLLYTHTFWNVDKNSLTQQNTSDKNSLTQQNTSSSLTLEMRKEIEELISRESEHIYSRINAQDGLIYTIAALGLGASALILKKYASDIMNDELEKKSQNVENLIQKVDDKLKKVDDKLKDFNLENREKIKIYSLINSVLTLSKFNLLNPVLMIGMPLFEQIKEDSQNNLKIKKAKQIINLLEEKEKPYQQDKLEEDFPEICLIRGDINYIDGSDLKNKKPNLSSEDIESYKKSLNIAKENYENALEFFKKKLDDESSTDKENIDRTSVYEILCKLGNTFATLDNYGKAIDQYDEVIKGNYFEQKTIWQYWAHHSKGDSLYNLKNYQEAVEEYQKAINLARQDNTFDLEYETYYRLGVAYATMGDYQAAKEHYQLALDVEIDRVKRANQDYRVWSALGDAYFKLSKGRDQSSLKEAQKCYEKSLLIKKDYWQSKYELALVFKYQEEDLEALQLFTYLEEFYQENPLFLCFHASILNKIGTIEEKKTANSYFEKALSKLELQGSDPGRTKYEKAIFYALREEQNLARCYLHDAINSNSIYKKYADYQPALQMLCQDDLSMKS